VFKEDFLLKKPPPVVGELHCFILGVVSDKYRALD